MSGALWMINCMGNHQLTNKTQGFTLIELLIAVVIMGILATIASPSWLGFMNRQKLKASQQKIFQGLQETKSKAITAKLTWQLSIREQDGVTQLAIHGVDETAFISPEIWNNSGYWQDLEKDVMIDQDKNDQGKYETTVRKETVEGPWRVQFNASGCPVYKPGDECGSTSLQALGRVTLRSRKGNDEKRCVIISTLIGAMRLGEEQPKVDSTGKYCH